MEEIVAIAWPYAMAVLVILGVIALVFLCIVLYRASVTMKSVKNMAAEAEKEVTPALAKVNPMVDKAELMLDTVNLEMLRVDAILEDVEQISDVAGKAATTVDTVTSAPAEAVTGIVDRIRGSLSAKRSNKEKQENLVFPVSSMSISQNDLQDSSTEDDDLKKEAQRLAEINVDINFDTQKATQDEATAAADNAQVEPTQNETTEE